MISLLLVGWELPQEKKRRKEEMIKVEVSVGWKCRRMEGKGKERKEGSKIYDG